MAEIRVELIAGYEYLASALVNGDESGLEPEDQNELNRFLDYVSPGYVVSCESESRRFGVPDDAIRRGPKGDIIDYVIHYID